MNLNINNIKEQLSKINVNKASEIKETEYSFEKNKKVYITFAILALVILLAGGFIIYRNAVNSKVSEDMIVLTIDGNSVRYSEFKTYIDYAMQIGGVSKIDNQVKKDAINYLLNQKAAVNLAKQKKISVSKTEYADLLSEDYNLSLCSNVSDLVCDDFALARKLFHKYADGINFSEDAIKEFYNNNISMFSKQAEINSSIILIKTRDAQGKQLDDNKMISVRNKLKSLEDEINAAPNIDFPSLVKKYSEDEMTKNKDGNVGFVSENKINPDLLKVMKDMKIGQISKPIESYSGYYIIKILDRNDAYTKSLSEAKDEVLFNLRQINGGNDYYKDIENMKSKMKVEIFQDAIDCIL